MGIQLFHSHPQDVNKGVLRHRISLLCQRLDDRELKVLLSLAAELVEAYSPKESCNASSSVNSEVHGLRVSNAYVGLRDGDYDGSSLKSDKLALSFKIGNTEDPIVVVFADYVDAPDIFLQPHYVLSAIELVEDYIRKYEPRLVGKKIQFIRGYKPLNKV